MAQIAIIGGGIGEMPCAYELCEVRSGSIAPIYERYVLKALCIASVKRAHS